MLIDSGNFLSKADSCATPSGRRTQPSNSAATNGPTSTAIVWSPSGAAALQTAAPNSGVCDTPWYSPSRTKRDCAIADCRTGAPAPDSSPPRTESAYRFCRSLATNLSPCVDWGACPDSRGLDTNPAAATIDTKEMTEAGNLLLMTLISLGRVFGASERSTDPAAVAPRTRRRQDEAAAPRYVSRPGHACSSPVQWPGPERWLGRPRR